MPDTRTQLENMVGHAKRVVEEMEAEGREVPAWAVEQVALSEEALSAHLHGKDWRYGYEKLLRLGELHKAEIDRYGE